MSVEERTTLLGSSSRNPGEGGDYVNPSPASGHDVPKGADESVAGWLRALQMPEYIQAFEANGVTKAGLLQLTDEELREDIGVRRLQDRRVLQEAIFMLQEEADVEMTRALPEDARSLTLQQNSRTFLGWTRLVIQLQTFAVAVVFLAPQLRFSRLVASWLTVTSVVVLLSAYRQYRRVVDQSELLFPHTEELDNGTRMSTVSLALYASFAVYVAVQWYSDSGDSLPLVESGGWLTTVFHHTFTA